VETKKQEISLDLHQFRKAQRSFAADVTIITTNDLEPESYVGMNANSFNSVSLALPLMLWNLAMMARSLPAFQASEYFAVSVLVSDYTELAGFN
jgi:3-hydroxy-9,10-secoandrosta-1,3,5(10)-triene-9,17-dione monooxygenase reductase component